MLPIKIITKKKTVLNGFLTVLCRTWPLAWVTGRGEGIRWCLHWHLLLWKYLTAPKLVFLARNLCFLFQPYISPPAVLQEIPMPVFTSRNGVHTSNVSLTLSEKEGVIYVRTMLFIPLLQHEDTRPFTCSRTFQSLYHTFTAMGLDPWAALWSCWWLARKTQQHKLGQCTHVPSLVSSSMHRRQQWLAEFHCPVL